MVRHEKTQGLVHIAWGYDDTLQGYFLAITDYRLSWMPGVGENVNEIANKVAPDGGGHYFDLNTYPHSGFGYKVSEEVIFTYMRRYGINPHRIGKEDALVEDTTFKTCALPECRLMKENLKLCSKCKSAWYCSKQCQVRDWKSHKTTFVHFSTSQALGATGNQPRVKFIRMPLSIQDIIDIPQVQDCLAHGLTNRDLIALSLVCKRWETTFARYLWRDASLRPNISVQGLARHGRFVQRIRIQQPDQIAIFAPYCHRVLSLHIELSYPLNEHHEQSPPGFLSTLWNFVYMNRATLQQLTLSFMDVDQLPLQPIDMPFLSDLWLVSKRITCQQVAMFLDHCPSLQHLDIAVDGQIDLVPEAFLQNEYRLCELNNNEVPRFWDLTLFLWKRCPNLNEFVIPFHDELACRKEIRQVLRMHPSKNRTLDFPYWSPPEEEVTDLVQACPIGTIGKVLYEGLTVTNTLWSTLLERQMSSLTLLDLSSCTVMLPRGSIQRVLCSCRTLQYFDAIPRRYPPNTTPAEAGMLVVRDVVKTPWVCLNIEVLRVVVIGICGESWFECQDQHDQCEKIKQGFMEQLQRLTKLAVLGISHAEIREASATARVETWPLGYLDGLRHLERLEIGGPAGRKVVVTQSLGE
ncbi:hypothetical protein BGW41_003116 [Actinomortierella wolfii]|nr:hypothetical protein BGW41_003116 [Actinomortierella wolfii]